MKARLCLCGFLLIPLGLFAQKKLKFDIALPGAR